MNTESRSPMIASGVATPNIASSNITTVNAMPATSPASKPRAIAFPPESWLGELIEGFLGHRLTRMKHRSEEESAVLGSISVLVRVHPWLLLRCNPQKRRQDPRAGDECAAHRARNLGDSAGPATMIHRNFENA